MTLPRIFIPTKILLKQKINLDPAISSRVLQVLRLQLNDPLIIFDNSDGEFKASLVAANKHQAVVLPEEFVDKNNESPLLIHLGQGISRGEKMDFTIQKAVELGVATITPLFTDYCNVKLDDTRLEKRLQHWQGVAISAAEQSGRCQIPQVLSSQNLTNWCQTQTTELRLVFDPTATHKLSNICLTQDQAPTGPAPTISILIGPEGGLSEKELTIAKHNNFLPVTLGPRILRTETAALTVISILQAQWGDL